MTRGRARLLTGRRSTAAAGLALAGALALTGCSDAADTEVQVPDIPETVAPGDVGEGAEGGEGAGGGEGAEGGEGGEGGEG